MADMTGDLPLVVPVSVLEEFFQCSVCMNHMNNTMMTPCGHRYCHKCITEWADRNHTCPCCNAQLFNKQLIKDYQFDNLIAVVNFEKEKAEDKYFETLINTASDESEFSNRKYSPVEQVLKKHLKQSLAAHENYFLGLKNDFAKRKHFWEQQLQRSLDTLQLEGLPPADISEKSDALEKSFQEKCATLSEELDRCNAFVADAYDRYLQSHIPSLEILPVSVSVLIVEKNIRIPDLIFQPVDCLNVIQGAVERTLQERGDPVLRWDYSGRIILVGPLSRCNQTELAAVLSGPIDPDMYPDVHQVTWQTKPIIQFGMKPGTEIVLIQCLKCESDMPKVCFVEQYKTQGSHPVDYFSCTQCGFNWICRSCIQICHQGHDTKPYVMNHKPTWACCYCPKKKKCHLLKPRSEDMATDDSLQQSLFSEHL
ncbi:uncharacterized protein LOC121385151 [Gigantopelta aegis]|uniref:uncharacterized protein LOC121385151 n=1 Tax=Gigantopelta aegis TaxID=1735272 RepID=UPI001B88E558|nr:uncharacterized protein LOC121385151 [Gigantopelta aegis]